MRGLRCDRIMVGTALALVLASPLAAMAQEATQAPKVAAGLVEASASPQAQSPAPNELPANARTPSPAENSRPGNVEGDSERGSNHDLFASLDPADRAIAEKIRELLAGNAGRIFSGSEERSKVEAFYQKRQFAPLWLDKGSENARKASVASRLEHADVDGLEVADYRIPTFTGSAPDALAEAELKLTQSILTYARHLQAGRFFRHQVKYEIGLPQAAPDPEEVLAKLAEAPDPGAALDAFSPQIEPYRRLKAMLAKLRESRTVRKLNGPGPDRTIEPSSPTWSAGAGIRATLARRMCWSISPISRSR